MNKPDSNADIGGPRQPLMRVQDLKKHFPLKRTHFVVVIKKLLPRYFCFHQGKFTASFRFFFLLCCVNLEPEVSVWADRNGVLPFPDVQKSILTKYFRDITSFVLHQIERGRL